MECFTEEFKQKYKELTTKRKNASQKELKAISDTISIIHSLLYDNKVNKYQRRSDFIIKENSEYYNRTKFLWNYFEGFAQTVMFQYYDDKMDLNLDNETIFNLVHDFFINATDDRTKKLFLKMYKERKNTVRIFDTPVSGSSSTYSIFLPFYRSTYIKMNKEKSFVDVAMLAHEYGHGIHYLTHYSQKLYSSVFCEIAALFFEFLSLHYYANNTQYMEYAKLARYNELDSLVINANLLCEEIEISKRINSDILSKKCLKKEIRNIISNDKEIVRIMLDYQVSCSYPHLISSLIAIELFFIYLEDRDKAFYLLNNIMHINYSKDDSISFSKIKGLGIEPLEHLEEYRDIIVNDMDQKHVRIRSV